MVSTRTRTFYDRMETYWTYGNSLFFSTEKSLIFVWQSQQAPNFIHTFIEADVGKLMDHG